MGSYHHCLFVTHWIEGMSVPTLHSAHPKFNQTYKHLSVPFLAHMIITLIKCKGKMVVLSICPPPHFTGFSNVQHFLATEKKKPEPASLILTGRFSSIVKTNKYEEEATEYNTKLSSSWGWFPFLLLLLLQMQSHLQHQQSLCTEIFPLVATISPICFSSSPAITLKTM